MKNKFQQRGFTLIELLVVIVILGILSTISVGTFSSYFAKARDSERVSTVQNLAMMMKVDSGGAGNCGVYNYGDGADTTTGDTVSCAHMPTGRAQLLADNDYSMPDAKNGLNYYYAVAIGATEGDNEFFVAIGAEEANPQNGKIETGGTTPEYMFVDGTTLGITAALTGDDATECDMDSGVLTCLSTKWELVLLTGTASITLCTDGLNGAAGLPCDCVGTTTTICTTGSPTCDIAAGTCS